MKRKFIFAFVAIAGIAAAWPIAANRRANADRQYFVEQRSQQVFKAGAKAGLEQSPQLTIFSIEPSANFGYGKNPFHDHEILGKTVISGPEKSDLLASLYNGLVPRPRNDGLRQVGLCFNPRHALRAMHNGKTIDLLICFSCQQVKVYENNKQINHSFISAEPRPEFDQVLTQARVPLSHR